jgi:ketosteroid isomerase-like protein
MSYHCGVVTGSGICSPAQENWYHALSRDNVEVVREIYRAFREHRFPDALLADDFVWETNPSPPGAGTYEGRDAVRAYFRDWVAGWYEVDSDVEELVERGDQVVALIHGTYRVSPEAKPLEAR